MFSKAIHLAYRQLTHRGAKLIGALAGVCVAIVLMFMQVGFENALYDSALNIPKELDADLVVTSPHFRTLSFTPPWFSRNALQEALGVKGVAASAPLYIFNFQVQSHTNSRLLPVWLFGIPTNQQVFLNPDINAQRDTIARPDSALLDRQSRRSFTPVFAEFAREGTARLSLPSGTTTLQPVTQVGGMFSLGPTFSIDGTLITSDLNFYRMTGRPLDRVSLGVVRIAPGEQIDTVAQRLDRYYQGRLKVWTKAEFLDSERAYYATQTPIGYIFRVGLLVGIAVGIVFISQALHGIISDNLREYAVLRAMGYHDQFFIMLVGGISVVFAVIAYLPSLIVTEILYRAAAYSTQLPLVLKANDMLLIFAIVLFMGVIATALALRKLRKANPVDLFA